MNDFIFYHKEHKCNPITISANGITQEIVCELAENLCADDIVFINGKYYTHINLPDFLHDMSENSNVDLDKLYENFREELWNCVWQQSQNVTNYISKLKS